MRALGRIAGKLARPTTKLLLAAILCTVPLSLAACSGEQGLLRFLEPKMYASPSDLAAERPVTPDHSQLITWF